MATDWLRRFHLEDAGVRGVIVKLDQTWREIASHASYPEGIAALLAETVAASALFAGNIKMAGTISLQLKSQGAISLAFAECQDDGEVRGLARWDGDVEGVVTPESLGAGSVLAITIEHPSSNQRYQGLVPLVGDSFSEAFEHYFEQSEQLPTSIKIVAGPNVCAGMLVQQIAAAGGRPQRNVTPEFERVNAVFRTLKDEELATLPPETVLRRLFPEDDVRLADATPLKFGCRCSRERVAAMLGSLGRDEAFASLTPDGIVEVQCQFCARTYRFDPTELEAIFIDGFAVPGPPTPQ